MPAPIPAYNLPRRNATTMKARGLKRTLPNPNIVRIELLDGLARQRYLGTVQAAGDLGKSVVHETIAPKSDRVFYGLLKPGHQQQFRLDANWNLPGGTAPVINQTSGVVKDVTNKAAEKGSESKSLKTRTLSKIPQAAVVAGTGINDLTRLVAGVTSTNTGSTNLKNYGGTELKGFSVTCAWYLPEQYRTCMKSLQVLTRMSYPLQVHTADWLKAQKKLASWSLEKYREYINNQGVEDPNLPPVDLFRLFADAARAAKTSTGELFRNLTGAYLTYDPLPVRVCIGHYVDVEPLVIENVSMAFSDDTFVLTDETEGVTGRHIPIMGEVTIKFKYWLNPAPKLGFTTLIGEEMFGQDIAKFDEANGEIR